MKKLELLLSLLIVVTLILSIIGCGGDDEDKTPTPTSTGGATETPKPTGMGYTGGKHTFKVAHTSQPNTGVDILWKYIDERLKYYTDGQVKLEIYPAASLYGTFEMWYAVVTGALDIASMADFTPQAAGLMDYQIGFLNFFWGATFDTVWDHDRRFWDHPEGGMTMLSQTEKAGVKMLTCFPSGIIQVIINKFGMDSVYDIKNVKYSSVGGLTGLFTEVAGGIQLVIDPAEFNIAFQQGLVDVSCTGPESCVSQRLYEIGKYGLVMSCLVTHTFWGMNLSLWNRLSAELQDVIQNKVIPDAMEWSLAERRNAELNALKELEEAGVTLTYQDDAERIDIRDKAWVVGLNKGFYKGMDMDLIKLADKLRSEPYDQGELLP